jgi:hypothetical protein
MVQTVVVTSSGPRGVSTSQRFSHYSLLRTAGQTWNLGYLVNAFRRPAGAAHELAVVPIQVTGGERCDQAD